MCIRDRVKRNSTLTELPPYALRELVKAVYVDAPDKSSGKHRQKDVYKRQAL